MRKDCANIGRSTYELAGMSKILNITKEKQPGPFSPGTRLPALPQAGVSKQIRRSI